jgi:cobalt/nickel transport protein
LLLGVAISIAVAVGAAYFASSHPDGLERVAEDKEFIETAEEPGYEMLPDYTVPGIENEGVSTALAGIVGVAVMAAIGFGAGKLLSRRRAESSPASGGASPPTAG